MTEETEELRRRVVALETVMGILLQHNGSTHETLPGYKRWLDGRIQKFVDSGAADSELIDNENRKAIRELFDRMTARARPFPAVVPSTEDDW